MWNSVGLLWLEETWAVLLVQPQQTAILFTSLWYRPLVMLTLQNDILRTIGFGLYVRLSAPNHPFICSFAYVQGKRELWLAVKRPFPRRRGSFASLLAHHMLKILCNNIAAFRLNIMKKCEHNKLLDHSCKIKVSLFCVNNRNYVNRRWRALIMEHILLLVRQQILHCEWIIRSGWGGSEQN